ncbi:unnamed protein product [Heligmosomoides polygyrus]|uniref:Saposin B-type domain-containing protein n=1 Tax=Heligmosomoides polygyrus TaxID=6339 RepID=A0A183GN92_HELPZ|nr:unnamed protein product [Heligmosomoides polygyrus]
MSFTSEKCRIAMDIFKAHCDDKVTMRHIIFPKLAQLPACDAKSRHLPVLCNSCMFFLVRLFSNGCDD